MQLVHATNQTKPDTYLVSVWFSPGKCLVAVAFERRAVTFHAMQPDSHLVSVWLVSVWLQFVHAAVVGEQAVRFFFDVAHLGVDVAGKTARLKRVHMRDEGAHGGAPLVDVVVDLVAVALGQRAVTFHAMREAAEFRHEERAAATARPHGEVAEIVVHAVEIAAALVVPAAHRVDDARRIEPAHLVVSGTCVELAPTFIEE